MTNSFCISRRPLRLTMLLLIASALLAGCSQHPKATSRESLEFIKQVYTACNTKDSKRLALCDERLAELQAEEKISKEEVKSFKRVLEIASKGDWESAQDIAFQFAKDQIR